MKSLINVYPRYLFALATAAAGASFAQQSPGSATASPPAAAVPGAAAPVPAARGPELALALEAASTAVKVCTERSQKIGVTVLDSAGVIKVVLAADGTSPRGVASGQSKALAALQYKTASGVLQEQVKTDKALADAIAADPKLNPRAGAVLIKVGDDIIGAIGVGGARGSDVDEACAVAGLQAVQSRLR